jgi:cell volume regulation protein A
VSDTYPFALAALTTAAIGLVALLSNRLTERLKLPAPLIVLVAAAIAVKVFPGLHTLPERSVERLVTVALICILFDGGLHIGWGRFRSAAAPIAVVGVLGTFFTVAAAAVSVHLLIGGSWYLSLLVATAVSPTDPAVVFSVLGRREVAGRSGTILEGESGANDPVGIALMSSLLTAGHLSGTALGQVAWQFLLQMGVGLAVGIVGARLLLWFMRAIPLPSEGLYPLRTAACAVILFAFATLAHGSGFLAVFVAGIALGDARAPYKREIERFHAALASLGEIVAFVVLGLTVNLTDLSHRDVWLPGLVLGAVLAFLIRPVLVGLCLIPARLTRNENAFVLFAGLKGAVPILLGLSIVAAHVAHAGRLYGIVIIVVAFSVLVQGSLVPTVARLLHLPMRFVELEPWSLGVRLRNEPDGVHRLTIAEGALADGRRVDDLDGLPDGAWISLVVRNGNLLPLRGDVSLHAGDQVTVIGDSELHAALTATFVQPAAKPDLG